MNADPRAANNKCPTCGQPWKMPTKGVDAVNDEVHSKSHDDQDVENRAHYDLRTRARTWKVMGAGHLAMPLPATTFAEQGVAASSSAGKKRRRSA